MKKNSVKIEKKIEKTYTNVLLLKLFEFCFFYFDYLLFLHYFYESTTHT